MDLKGRRPSMFVMTMRLAWWVLGPINPLLDLIFLTNEEHKQTIRDKLMGTYVIKLDAEPAGRGNRRFSRWSFMGFMFAFPEVETTGPGESDGTDAG